MKLQLMKRIPLEQKKSIFLKFRIIVFDIQKELKNGKFRWKYFPPHTFLQLFNFRPITTTSQRIGLRESDGNAISCQIDGWSYQAFPGD